MKNMVTTVISPVYDKSLVSVFFSCSIPEISERSEIPHLSFLFAVVHCSFLNTLILMMLEYQSLNMLQLWKKYMRKSLVLTWIPQYRKTLIYIFQHFSSSIKKILRLEEDWALGYNSMKFWDFPDFS